MSEGLTIVVEQSGVVSIEGVRFSGFLLKEALQNPPADCLFNVRRNGDDLVFQRITTADEAKAFFDTLSPAGAQSSTTEAATSQK